ncbi:MAG: CPBP family glutamic-type intramembrane protease [Lachnoclostridium sp.]
MKKLIVTFVISVVGGIVFSLDHWVFGSMIDGIQAANVAGSTVSGVIASVLYGGIIEEVMLRLFFMSLIAFIVWKLFFKKLDKENIPTSVFVVANIVAALLFAAGHLPATISIFGILTPLILFRCFLLNGGFGIASLVGCIASMGLFMNDGCIVPYREQVDLAYFYLSVHNEQTAAISIPLSDGSCSSFSVLWILLFLL